MGQGRREAGLFVFVEPGFWKRTNTLNPARKVAFCSRLHAPCQTKPKQAEEWKTLISEVLSLKVSRRIGTKKGEIHMHLEDTICDSNYAEYIS